VAGATPVPPRTADAGAAADGYGRSGGKIRVRIHDRLDVGQVRDSVVVTIGGVSQRIELNENASQAYVEFIAPNPGRYSVTMQSSTAYYYQGRLVSVKGQGQGTLDVQSDCDYEVVMNSATNPPTLSLRPVR
jgi:hypothetical protein